MPTEYIPYRKTNYFSPLICDYLDEIDNIKKLYNRFPNIENFEGQIEEKMQSYSHDIRKDLVKVLLLQYQGLKISAPTLSNIDLLKHKTTFTVTTGHQLNLFTGPLYFLYKIISTINLTKELKEAYPQYNFVPVYWMATEDHDFNEINYFNFQNKKLQWNVESAGAVGRLQTDGLDEVLGVFEKELGHGTDAKILAELFKKAYLEQGNLSKATHYLANELFGSYGLIILDADHSDLKQLFTPYIEKELLENSAYNHVSRTNKYIEELDYKVQVNPREINLFYLTDALRERIVFQDDTFIVYGTDISWSKEDMLQEIKDHPERFSPNAIMRPLYQEVILPNLCYIGGGGELAYWLQLKDYFESVKVTFPILLLRNSVLITTEKQTVKLDKLELTIKELFLDQEALIAKQTKKISSVTIDFTPQKEHLQKQFEELYDLATKTDKSFLGAVGAQERKQIKGLENLEKRLMKAQKRKLKDEIERVTRIQNLLFPNQSLQERQMNFSEFYVEYGDDLISKLVDVLQPLKSEFTILTI